MGKVEKEILYKKLEAMEEADIKAQLANPGFFADYEVPYVKNWLNQKKEEREALVKSKELQLAEEANKIAEEANDKADSANRWSIIATVISAVAVLAAIIALFKP